MVPRHQLRWLNGAGFALTLFFAAWAVVFLFTLLGAQFEDAFLPMPPAFAIVAGISLAAMVVLLGIVVVGHLVRGADMNHWKARLFLFAWTCAGALFCASQTAALLRSSSHRFPHVAGWFSSLYWYFCVVGTVVFLVLLWVNAESQPVGSEQVEFDDGP